MTKSAARRSAIVDALADHVLDNGLGASSLRDLAQAAGTSDRMLLYYFADKVELIGATLARISERLVAIMAQRSGAAPRDFATVRQEVAQVVLSNDLWPYMRIWLELASLSAFGEPMYRTVGEAIGRGFYAWGLAQLDIPDEQECAREAARLLVFAEGLVLLKSLGLDDIAHNSI